MLIVESVKRNDLPSDNYFDRRRDFHGRGDSDFLIYYSLEKCE